MAFYRRALPKPSWHTEAHRQSRLQVTRQRWGGRRSDSTASQQGPGKEPASLPRSRLTTGARTPTAAADGASTSLPSPASRPPHSAGLR